jgi:hypothetical protein
MMHETAQDVARGGADTTTLSLRGESVSPTISSVTPSAPATSSLGKHTNARRADERKG